jgi:NAD-dependent protein deacetylase/lipoamidase
MSGNYPDIRDTISTAADLIRHSPCTVVLTGAGISTPSGIPDFRSPQDGLWTHYNPVEVASLTAFRHDPEKFYLWLHPLAIQMQGAQPNPAHIALARLQNTGYISVIITQNIDGLHTKAGSKDVLEVHGTLNTMTCTNCYKTFPAEQYVQAYIERCDLPYCKACGSILKPDVILYDEQLPKKTWLKAEDACKKCDLLIVTGTSLEVMPSAKLPLEALEHGAQLIIINNTETFMDERALVLIHDNVADILPKIADEVLNA